MKFLKVLFSYVTNLFIYNKEGWYIGDGAPSGDSQLFRVRAGKKPYSERTCVMCKRDFWSHKKPEVCFRIECYFKYRLARGS
jgi:hypothetical protein